MWWSHYCFFILLFLVSLWLSSQIQIISSFRNLCSKHLLTGMCFEGNVAEKQILPEQRKEKTVQTTVRWAARLLHSIYCGGPRYCWLAPLPCESPSKDSKRKADRKFESEEKAPWRRGSCHRKEGATWFPLPGGLPQDPEHHTELRCMHIFLQPVYLHLYMGAFSLFVFVLFCWLQFGQTIQDHYLSSVPKSLSFSNSVVEATEFLEYETNVYIYIYIAFFFLNTSSLAMFCYLFPSY